MTLGDWAALAAVIGIGFGVAQLWLARRLARTAFEDQIATHYRDLLGEFPVTALLNEPVDVTDGALLRVFYRYVDLCNEQIFLRSRRRVSAPTWANWADGMRTQFQRPAFKAAWEAIQAKDGSSFQELRRAEREKFTSDPACW